MSKRLLENEVVTCFTLIDDVLESILAIPLIALMSSTKPETNVNIIEVFHIPLVSQQWYRVFTGVTKQLKFSWLDKMQHFHYQVQRHHRFLSLEIYLGKSMDTQLRMARTSEYYYQRKSTIQREIEAFIETHKIVYRTAKGKIYTGKVGMKKLAKIKVAPKALADEYKTLFIAYNNAHRKMYAATDALGRWFGQQPIMRYAVAQRQIEEK